MTNNTAYLTQISGRFSQNSIAPLVHALQELQLPVPAQGEFLRSFGGSPFFLNRFGAVVRICHVRDLPILRSKHLMRPVAAIQVTHNLRLDIQPAGRTNVSAEDVEAAYRFHFNRNLLVRDKGASNYMYVGPTNIAANFDPHGLGSIERDVRNMNVCISGSCRILDLSPIDDEEPDEQDECYGPLRQAFVAAHDPKSDSLTPEGVKAFWHAMEGAVGQGLLTAPWTTPSDLSAQKKGVLEISERYAQRLENPAHDFHNT